MKVDKEKFYVNIIKSKGRITEEEFIGKYDNIELNISESLGWFNYNTNKYIFLDNDRVDMIKELKRISDVNEWARKDNWSENLKLFLKLRGALK
jgi:hypothetical protein